MSGIVASMKCWGSLAFDGEKFNPNGEFERILAGDIIWLVARYYEENEDAEWDEETMYKAANWADKEYQSQVKGGDIGRNIWPAGYSAEILPFRRKS